MKQMKNFILLSFGMIFSLMSYAQGADNCSTAQSLSIGSCDNFVNNEDNENNTFSSCGGGNDRSDVWYTFTGNGNNIDIGITATNRNLTLAIYTSCPGSYTSDIACTNIASGATGSVTLSPTVNGQTYYVRIKRSSGNGTANHSGTVCLTDLGFGPANDNCSGAQSVTPNGSCQTGTTVGANDSWTGAAGCATTGSDNEHLDVWYSFVATGGVFDITATDISIGGDLEIILAEPGTTPCVDAFTILGSWCGASPLAGNYVGLTVGNTYYYTVSSPNLQTGDFQTCVTTSTITNDLCSGAIPITVGAGGICTEVTGTNSGASDSGVSSPGCANYLGGDVWYSVTVPASGNVTFGVDYAISNSISDGGMAIYSGTCGSLSMITCDDDGGTGLLPNIQATGLTPGSTVFVRFWEYGNDVQGNFDLCFSEPIPSLTNQDCVSSLPICTSSTFGGNSDGPGSISDLYSTNDDCLSGENQTSWLYLEISTPGNFKFTITPDNGTDDYDFAVWHYPGGTGQTCPPADGTVTRCSFGAGAGFGGSYDTGLDDGAIVGGSGPGDQSESASGDNWVDEIAVATGDVVVMVIDNYSSTTSPYTLNFTGNAGLDCTILPTELLTYYVSANGDDNEIHWVTASEKNNDYFTIEHSTDGKEWEVITKVKGAGSSDEKLYYSTRDLNVEKRVNYYRFHQTDFDGTSSNYKIVSIDNSMTDKMVVVTTNLLGQEVDSNYRGIVIDVHEDGTSLKRMQY